MNKHLTILITVILSSFVSYKVSGQKETISIRGFEIGLNFVRFNNYLNPFEVVFKPDDNRYFNFDLIPGILLKAPIGKNSLRLKYEYSQHSGSFTTDAYDFSGHVAGKYLSTNVFLGIERYFVNSQVKVYGLIDLGLSNSKFNGLFWGSLGLPQESSVAKQQKIKAFGVSFNPGIGIKYQILDNFILTIESSVGIERFFKSNDQYHIFMPSRLVLRPISTVGISYAFTKTK